MGFYDSPENVDKYIEMCADYDGSQLYYILKKYLNEGSSMLELGSGPGLDIPFLSSHYKLTASDLSDEFIIRLKNKFSNVPVLKMDARAISVQNKFDCIFSNKVLHHLTREELKSSLQSQSKILTSTGLVAHSFWIGEEDQEIEGLLFTYYTRNEILDLISNNFEILLTHDYREFDDGDSLFIIGKSTNF